MDQSHFCKNLEKGEEVSRPIFEIAREIRKDWKKVNYVAEPYLKAMEQLITIQDLYFFDTAVGVVLYFLSNANSWKGEVARRVKAELKEMAKCNMRTKENKK